MKVDLPLLNPRRELWGKKIAAIFFQAINVLVLWKKKNGEV